VVCVGVILLAGWGSTDGDVGDLRPVSHSGYGTLSGLLLRVGGPVSRPDAQPSPLPLTGHVVATGRAGSFTATMGTDGRYTLQLPPGSYAVTGTSPQINGGNSTCPANRKVSVGRHQKLSADVYCGVR